MVEWVSPLARDIGDGLKALAPDGWILSSKDHTNQIFLNYTPAFAFHVGGKVAGSFAGRAFNYDVDSETAPGLVEYLQGEGFDSVFASTFEMEYSAAIPLEHLGVDAPIVPLYVNAHVPPQPSMERCCAPGGVLARGLALMGKTAVVVASGGMSHFPGTERYSSPALLFDKALMERLKAGHFRSLLALDARRLDETGNIELRCWGVAAGALGERILEIAYLDPSWHHNYGTVGWITASGAQAWSPHYPVVRAERVALTAALHKRTHDAAAREHYLADPAGFASSAGLSGDDVGMLVAMDVSAMVACDIHSLVAFLAQLQIGRA